MPKAAAPRSSTQSDRVVLAKAVADFTKAQQGFTAAVAAFENITATSIEEIDMQIDEKRKQLDEVAEEQEQAKKRARIDTANAIAEDNMAAATQILEQRNMTAIANSELEQLRAENAQLRAATDAAVEKAVDDANKSHRAALQSAVKNAELQHTANTAELNAQVGQQSREIAMLKEMVQNLKSEIADQRQLTKDVAEANSSGAITQSFGGH